MKKIKMKKKHKMKKQNNSMAERVGDRRERYQIET